MGQNLLAKQGRKLQHQISLHCPLTGLFSTSQIRSRCEAADFVVARSPDTLRLLEKVASHRLFTIFNLYHSQLVEFYVYKIENSNISGPSHNILRLVLAVLSI